MTCYLDVGHRLVRQQRPGVVDSRAHNSSAGAACPPRRWCSTPRPPAGHHNQPEDQSIAGLLAPDIQCRIGSVGGGTYDKLSRGTRHSEFVRCRTRSRRRG